MRRHLLVPVFCILAAALAAAAQDERPPVRKGLVPYWTGIHDATGHCRYSIPPNWDRPGGDQIARAPDGSVVLEQSWLPEPDWASYKSKVRRVLSPTVIHEDSAQRLSFEYRPGWPGDHLFVAVPAAVGVCATQIDMRDGARAALRSTIEKLITGIVALE